MKLCMMSMKHQEMIIITMSLQKNQWMSTHLKKPMITNIPQQRSLLMNTQLLQHTHLRRNQCQLSA